MKKEDVSFFVGKIVKLVRSNGFVLIGKIVKVNDDNIFFETDQASSVISLDTINEITLKKEE